MRAAARIDEAPSEVKGMYFVTARQYLIEHHGAEALTRAAALMPVGTRPALLDPLPSDWYPESALHDAFHAVATEVCVDDEKRFLELLEECTRAGMNRFFRALLGITSPTFFLKRYPTLVKQLRRGPMYAEVDVRTGEAAIRIAELPYADDRLYQLGFVAGLNAVFNAMIGRRPGVRVRSVTPRGFVIDVDWRTAAPAK